MGESLELMDRTGGAADLEAVRVEIGMLETLEDVFRWTRSSGIHDGTEDLIVQDEFTHDAIFPYRNGLFLVIGLTWLGAIRSVSVWDHRPSAREILDDRVRRGWKPTPSLLKDGDRVLGYASCLLSSEDS